MLVKIDLVGPTDRRYKVLPVLRWLILIVCHGKGKDVDPALIHMLDQVEHVSLGPAGHKIPVVTQEDFHLAI